MLRAIRQRSASDISSDYRGMDDPEIAAIDATMRAQGKSRADLGRLLGLDSAQVSRTFAGRRRLQIHEHRLVADWLGMQASQSLRPTAAVVTMPGMVPLFGWAGASSDDQLTLAEPNMLGTVPMHPSQVHLRKAFAVRVHGDSMAPRYEHGEIVYVAPNQWPSRDQDCLIETKDSFGFIKRFKRRIDAGIVVFQFNPPKELTFDITGVRTLHAIIGRG